MNILPFMADTCCSMVYFMRAKQPDPHSAAQAWYAASMCSCITAFLPDEECHQALHASKAPRCLADTGRIMGSYAALERSQQELTGHTRARRLALTFTVGASTPRDSSRWFSWTCFSALCLTIFMASSWLSLTCMPHVLTTAAEGTSCLVQLCLDL